MPNAAKATSFSGAPMPLETAGTPKATAPAQNARRPSDGLANAVTVAANIRPSVHCINRHATGPLQRQGGGVEHFGHERIDGFMQCRLEPDRFVSQEHLRHLQVIAECVSVGDGTERGEKGAEDGDGE